MQIKSAVIVSLIIVILYSHVFVISNISAQIASQDEKIHDNQKRSIHEVEFKTAEGYRDAAIIQFDTFKHRDAAISSLSQVGYSFKQIPAVTVSTSNQDFSKLTGVVNIIQDRKVAKLEQEVTTLPENGKTSLKTSAQITGVDALRSTYNLTGSGHKIAILDTGINPNLAAFQDSKGKSRVEVYNVSGILENAETQLDDHGSHVAGIAVGNGKYLVNGEMQQTDSYGMAPEADILSIRVLDSKGSGDNSWILEGIDYALNRSDVEVISMSLSTNLFYGETDLHRLLLEQAPHLGKIIVAAAGNEGPMGSGLGIPGGLESVIGVGAYDITSGFFDKWEFSAVGPAYNDFVGPDVIAPGKDILSVNVTDNSVLSLSGTSMATPHVSGSILLLKEAFPNANPYQIREAILASAVDIGLQVEVQGRGRIDFSSAYRYLSDIMENDTIYTPTLPNKFYDGNYYFRNRLYGVEKTFPVFIISHRDAILTPHVDPRTHGVEFTLPSVINLTQGYHKFDLKIVVSSSNVELNVGYIYFTNVDGQIVQSANITYFSETRFKQGTILFDTSHDLDTPSGYFANDGPRGQFSRISRSFEEEGYVVMEHREGEITSNTLKNADLLIIADPDVNVTFTAAEVQVINDFVQKDGKSMLIMANGGFLMAEDLKYETFNLDGVNSLLKGSGISIPSINAVIPCNHNNIGDRERNCPRDAYFLGSQDVFQPVLFPNYGPALEVSGSAEVLAYQNDQSGSSNPVVARAEFPSKGRILVFSSMIPLDNIGTTTDYVGGGSDVNNRQIGRDAVEWLLEPRSLHVDYTINNNPVEKTAKVTLNEPFDISLQPTYPNATPIHLGDAVDLRASFDPLDGSLPAPFNLTATRLSDGTYEITGLSFGLYGIYTLYLPIEQPGMVPTAGKLAILAELYFYNNRENIHSVAEIILILLLVSWIIWVRNEGGWQLAKKRKEGIE